MGGFDPPRLCHLVLRARGCRLRTASSDQRAVLIITFSLRRTMPSLLLGAAGASPPGAGVGCCCCSPHQRRCRCRHGCLLPLPRMPPRGSPALPRRCLVPGDHRPAPRRPMCASAHGTDREPRNRTPSPRPRQRHPCNDSMADPASDCRDTAMAAISFHAERTDCTCTCRPN